MTDLLQRRAALLENGLKSAKERGGEVLVFDGAATPASRGKAEEEEKAVLIHP